MTIHKLGENLSENEVGSKAYNLSLMIKAGIPVPPGIVVKNHYYQNQDQLNSSALGVATHHLKSPYLMVRSSAIGEDGQDYSFAGQLDSFISENQTGEIFNFVTKCWESLENSRSQTYGEYLGKNLDSMGVIIQEMIEPDFAGVLFTHSPLNPDECYLEWVEGHAEKLVSGKVTPASISFSKKKLPGDVPFNLEKLVHLASEILKLYQKPQDIEWVARGKDIFIVQSRPITTIKPKLSWSNTNVNENYPEKLSPFLDSLARKSYYHYFKNLARAMGVYQGSGLESEAAFSNIIGTWGQRMYYNMSHIHQVLALTPFEGLFKKSFDDFVGYQKEISASQRLNTLKRKVSFGMKVVFYFFKLEKNVQKIERDVDEFYLYAQKAQELTELSKAYHQFLNLRFYRWYRASFADFYAMITHGILGKVSKLIDEKNAQGIQNGLLQAIPGLISNRPIFEMYQMHALIVSDKKYESLMRNDVEVIWKTLSEKQDDKLSQLVHKYLLNWGYRCSGELTFLTPNYFENPMAFIQVLKQYHLTHPQNPNVLFARKHAEQKLLLEKTVSQSFGASGILKFIIPLILKPLVRMTSYGISCRERVRLKQAKMYFGAKVVLEHFGAHLVKKKILSEAKDIYFLEYQEITKLFSGDEVSATYFKNLISLRKQHCEEARQKKENFATLLGDFDNFIIGQDEVLTEGKLKGLPACGGEITGRIKILETVHEISRLEKGDILVTKQTDPGWICAFPMISGLIVEYGGMLSHGAIVAREFGIPAVVGVPGVTSLLKDGQEVYLNAYQGTIECLK